LYNKTFHLLKNKSPSGSFFHSATMNSGTHFFSLWDTHTLSLPLPLSLSYTYNHTATGCWPYLSHLGEKEKKRKSEITASLRLPWLRRSAARVLSQHSWVSLHVSFSDSLAGHNTHSNAIISWQQRSRIHKERSKKVPREPMTYIFVTDHMKFSI